MWIIKKINNNKNDTIFEIKFNFPDINREIIK